MLTILPVSNYIFITLIAGITAYSTFLTTKGGLTNNTYKNYWKKLTARGKRVLYFAITIIVLLLLQEWNSQTQANIKDVNTKKEIYKRDLLLQKQASLRDSSITEGIKKGVDLNRQKLFDDISKAFAKQELRLDTVKKNIERIRDSAKNVTNNYGQIDPVLVIEENGISIKEKLKNSTGYSISFLSRDAGSTNFDVKCYFLMEFPNGENVISRHDFFPKKLKLSNNGIWTAGFHANFTSSPTQFSVFVQGKYTTLDATKVYVVEDVYDLDLTSMKTSTPLNSRRIKIIQKIKSQPERLFTE